MALFKRGKRWWTRFSVNGQKFRKPLRPAGSNQATSDWREATQLERELIRSAATGGLSPQAGVTKLFEACDAYLKAKAATANTPRVVAFDKERLAFIRDHFGDIPLARFSRELIEGYQAKRRVDGVGNRTINMDVGVLRQVLKRYGHWRRLEDQVSMLTESGGAPIGRALTSEEQKRLFEAAVTKPEWDHVYCAGILAANTSMRGVEVKHLRRGNVDLTKQWGDRAQDVGVIQITRSKNETSQRAIPLNAAARGALTRMFARMDALGHTRPDDYIWCASQHLKYDPTRPATAWRTVWDGLRKAAGLDGLRFHDLRHTVVTDLLEAGEPDHVVEAITGHLSRKMLEHYSHQRIKAKGQALTRMEERRNAG